jgi:hypothetical protein
MTLISGFLATEVFGASPHDLDDLRRLEGRNFHELSLLSSIEECRAEMTPATPVYVLPVGAAAGFLIGLHLRPQDVAARRLAFVSIRDDASAIEFAPSPRYLVMLSLLRLEGAALQRGSTGRLDDAVRQSEEIFGKGFFVPGTHGDFVRSQAEEIALAELGPTPAGCLDAAAFAVDARERRERLREGIAADPGCMALRIRLALDYAVSGDDGTAATETVAALECYHHTAYGSDIDRIYDEGRALLQRVPHLFPEVARRDLLTTDEQDRMRWIIELYGNGDAELGAKLLSDMCHERADYDSVLPLFRRHFERLGWDWALRLCDLREPGDPS